MPARIDQDPFTLLLATFNARHGADVLIQWVAGMHDEEGAWGRTHFDQSPVLIEIDAYCPVAGALDVLAHELAHVAAGFDAQHGPAWESEKAALLAACAA